jgi:hypothetical protein
MPAKKKPAPKKSARTPRTASRKPPRREAAPKRTRREAPQEQPHRHEATGDVPPVSPFMPGMSAQCLVCPICMSLYALQQSRPEAMQHLMVAGHELFLAFRALVEAQGDRWEQVNTLQRISVR